ncbi:hypothetical protein LXA43DRAFT_944500 [Ganoderma leucocontextum]|nr:hypothetical protein LXA43DRAFT_944500 [Ganoderma leucocontextum]
MGNSYSVAQEEQEEAEFERLVRAVERAQRGSPGRHDLEAQYDVPESQERPPRPEKVMVWFRGRRGNRVTEPEAQTVPSPTARMQSAPIIHPPDSVALGQTCPAALHKTPSQPSSPSLQTTAPLSPPVTTEDSLLESAGAGSGLVGVVQPATTQSSQHDGEEHDNADKYSNNSNTSVDPPPSFKLRIPIPSAVVQAIPVASEHQPPVDHAPPTVGHPPSTMITLPAPILERPPSQSPSPRVQQPPFELRPGSRSRSREDVNSRHRSRSRGPFWPLRDSLTDFKDLFYRPVRQHGRSRSPDVSRGRSPAQRPVQSQHTPPTAVTLSETSKRLDEASHRYLPPSRSPSLVHRVHLIPSSHSRRRSRSPSPRYFQYPAGSRSRSPREPDVVPHDALPRPPPRCREPERYSSRSRSPAQRSVQSQHRARRPPSPQDSGEFDARSMISQERFSRKVF